MLVLSLRFLHLRMLFLPEGARVTPLPFRGLLLLLVLLLLVGLGAFGWRWGEAARG